MACETRFDISFAVSVLLHNLVSLTLDDVTWVKRVLRYIYESVNMKLIYHHNAKSKDFECYSGTDFGDCPDTHRSTREFVLKFAGTANTGLIITKN